MDNEDTYIKTSLESYVNLAQNKRERYEYVYPNIEFLKDIELDPSYKGTLTFNSNAYHKKYSINSHDSTNVNNFEYQSFDYILNNGLKNNFNLLIFSGFTKELSSDSRLLEYPLLDCCILAKAINAPKVTNLSTFNPGKYCIISINNILSGILSTPRVEDNTSPSSFSS